MIRNTLLLLLSTIGAVPFVLPYTAIDVCSEMKMDEESKAMAAAAAQIIESTDPSQQDGGEFEETEKMAEPENEWAGKENHEMILLGVPILFFRAGSGYISLDFDSWTL